MSPRTTLLSSALVLCLAGCWTRGRTADPVVCPTVEPVAAPESPDFPEAPWFAACAPGSLNFRGEPVVGCLTRAQVNAMGTFRLRYLAWQAMEKRPSGGSPPVRRSPR